MRFYSKIYYFHHVPHKGVVKVPQSIKLEGVRVVCLKIICERTTQNSQTFWAIKLFYTEDTTVSSESPAGLSKVYHLKNSISN